MRDHWDAVVLGGGLAGLTLARQLHREAPDVRILVLEKRRHPVPEAAFKVGESTVEIGAHYLQRVLDLDHCLRTGHLEKLGLRYFFPNAQNRELSRRFELGPAAFPAVPSFQIDRGRLENTLFSTLQGSGVTVLDGCTVKTVALRRLDTVVDFEDATGRRLSARARWIADASGRAGVIRHQLGLTRRVAHAANACWFRIRARVRVDDWAADPGWKRRVPSGERWLSTNHLMGRGYWVWLIPLGSGSTSFGIVADSALHPFSRLNRYERALDWLREFEPQCADVVQAHASRLEDFLALRHYAYGCSRVFSPDGWALVGEAGLFTDPFYSPGSDFIAIGNDYATDLISRAARGDNVSDRAEAFNTTYLRLFDAFLRLYEGQYPLMGNAQVMTAKVAWDNASYWAVPGLLYFQRRYRDPAFISSIEALLRRFFVLHARMQQLLRAWHLSDVNEYGTGFTNVLSVPELRRIQGELAAEPLEDEALRTKLEVNLRLLEAFARSWQTLAARRDPALVRFLHDAPGEPFDIGPLVLQPEIVPA
jgi:flavin-dependent dehydrogenase